MVWPIYLSILLIDDSLIEASQDLGAGSWMTFRDVILPLALPGVLAGLVTTFVPLLGDGVVPALLGGERREYLADAVMSLSTSMNYTARSRTGDDRAGVADPAVAVRAACLSPQRVETGCRMTDALFPRHRPRPARVRFRHHHADLCSRAVAGPALVQRQSAVGPARRLHHPVVCGPGGP